MNNSRGLFGGVQPDANDYGGLSVYLLNRSTELLSNWLPGGCVIGGEYCCGSIIGGSGKSCKTNIKTGKGQDFATGQAWGDLIGLYAEKHKISNSEAFQFLANEYNYRKSATANLPNEVTPVIVMPPVDYLEPVMNHPRHGKPSSTWCYRSNFGEVMFYVARYDLAGEKVYCPWVYVVNKGWVMKSWPAPRPLYNLPALIANPDKPVLMVEGEKSSDAAQKTVGEQYVVATWPHGAMAVDKVDWSPLTGRVVFLWPDGDDPGRQAMKRIADKLLDICASVCTFNVDDLQQGQDAADFNFTFDQFLAWMMPRLQDCSKNASIADQGQPNRNDVVEDVDVDYGSIFPCIPFPVDVFPLDLQRFIGKCSVAYSVSDNVIAGMVLTIISGSLGNTVRVQVREGWVIPVFLWLNIIGRSGSGKSPCLNALLEPIKKKACEEYQRYSTEAAEYERRCLLEKENKGNLKVPTYDRYFVTDTTMEGLVNAMKCTPRGIQLVYDEMSGLIKGLNQYKGGKGSDMAKYLEMFDCQPVSVERKGAAPLFVAITGCSILGGTQPLILRQVFETSSFINGLFPRFLSVMMSENPLILGKDGLSPTDMLVWSRYVEKCYEQEMKFVLGKHAPITFYFSQEAEDLFISYHNRLSELGRFFPDTAQVFLPKLITFGARISGVIHFLRHGFIEQKISKETVKDSLHVVDFFAGQVFVMLRQYNTQSKTIDPIQKLLLEAVRDAFSQSNSGKIKLSDVVDKINAVLPDKITLEPRKVSSMIRKLGFSTELIGGYSHILCDMELILKLSKQHLHTSTSSTTS